MASRSLLEVNEGQCLPMHTTATVERPCPLPTEDRYNSGVGQVLYDSYSLSRDKRTLTEPEKMKDNPT